MAVFTSYDTLRGLDSYTTSLDLSVDPRRAPLHGRRSRRTRDSGRTCQYMAHQGLAESVERAWTCCGEDETSRDGGRDQRRNAGDALAWTAFAASPSSQRSLHNFTLSIELKGKWTLTLTGREATTSFRFDAIGTGWEIASECSLPEDLRQRMCALAEEFDRVWSRFREDSLITRIARAEGGGRFEFPIRDLTLFELYDRLVAATNGAVDPLVGRDLEMLGYDARYSLVPDEAAMTRHRRPDSWLSDVRRDTSTITTDRPVVIDVGAAGKGYLVDLIADTLLDAGIDQFLVNGSGDLRHRGDNPVTVGLEHPTRPGRVIGKVSLRDEALCASATNRRTWGPGLHHVLDGRTRRPITDVIATWAIASDAATADGLATALLVTEPDCLRSFAFRWVRMLADGRIQWSNDFNGELFL